MIKLDAIKEILGKREADIPGLADIIEEIMAADEPDGEDLSGRVAELEGQLEQARLDAEERIKRIFFGRTPVETEPEAADEGEVVDTEEAEEKDIYELLYGGNE